jgi:hypothetical protein
MGIDPAFWSSAFGIVITQRADNQIQIMHAEEYQRPDFNQMLSTVWGLFRRFGKINKIYIDGSNPSFIRALSNTAFIIPFSYQLNANKRRRYFMDACFHWFGHANDTCFRFF